MTPILVTRPMPSAAQWVQHFEAAGVPAQAFPLIEIAAMATHPELNRARENWHEHDALMFVSGNAVRCFFQNVPTGSVRERAEQDGAVRAWSPGPGTTQALLERGWPLSRIDAPDADARQFDSESLWQNVALQIRPGLRVLIVRGADAQGVVAGRAWLRQRLQAARVVVEEVVAYQRVAPRLGPEQLALALSAAASGQWWLFSSSEAITHLVGCLPDVSWTHARALVTHPRIGDRACLAGFATIQETRPTLNDVMESIKRLP